MLNFDDLVGLNLDEARKILKENGYNKINVILNSKSAKECNEMLVCSVRFEKNNITLICGEFLVEK